MIKLFYYIIHTFILIQCLLLAKMNFNVIEVLGKTINNKSVTLTFQGHVILTNYRKSHNLKEKVLNTSNQNEVIEPVNLMLGW